MAWLHCSEALLLSLMLGRPTSHQSTRAELSEQLKHELQVTGTASPRPVPGAAYLGLDQGSTVVQTDAVHTKLFGPFEVGTFPSVALASRKVLRRQATVSTGGSVEGHH